MLKVVEFTVLNAVQERLPLRSGENDDGSDAVVLRVTDANEIGQQRLISRQLPLELLNELLRQLVPGQVHPVLGG